MGGLLGAGSLGARWCLRALARGLRPGLLAQALLLLVAAGCVATTADEPAAARPNVLLVVFDDLGFADLGVTGADGHRTPRLDALAAEGVLATDFSVASPACSASRAALLTGLYPTRVGITGALSPASTEGLPAEVETLPELLRAAGYRTALYGKWHLGHAPEHLPLRHGFERWEGLPYSNDMSPDPAHNPRERARRWPPLPYYVQDEVVEREPDQRTLTRRATEGALAFLRAGEAEDDRPWLCVVATSMPHVPLFTDPRFDGTGATRYGDVVQELDDAVGRLLDALEALGEADDTLVVVTSDNGPWLPFGDHAGSAGALREGKGTTFEGGVRVPLVARWPGVLPAGAVVAEPFNAIDLLPTLVEATGAPAPRAAVDGRSALDVLRARPGARVAREATGYFWGGAWQAVRAGRWKLHLPHPHRTQVGPAGAGGVPSGGGTGRQPYALYDLARDPGERVDRSPAEPAVCARLEAALARIAAGARPDGDRATAGVDVAPR